MESLIKLDPLAELQAENLRLIALLEDHGIEWRIAPESPPPVVLLKPESSNIDDFRKSIVPHTTGHIMMTGELRSQVDKI